MRGSLLLDTCAILWLVSDQGKLTSDARIAIRDAPVAYYSAISAWEISLKAATGKLSLPLSPREWFSRVAAKHGLERIALSEDILFRSTELPWFHRDPADRFIIATALAENLPVVSADPRFSRYGVKTLC